MRRRTFAILCFEGALLSFNVAACAALVPSVAREFLVPPFAAGPIVWIYMFSYGAAALVYGPLVRIIDARKVELVFFFLFCCANLLAAAAPGLGVLFAARFFMGIFGASVIPLVLILIGRMSDSRNRGRLVGIFFSATFIASLAGLFLSGIVHWRLIFLVPAVLGFVLWFNMKRYLPAFTPRAQSSRRSYLGVLKDPAAGKLFAYIFLVSLLYHGVQQWLGVFFALRCGLNQFMISMLVTLTALSGIFGEVLGGVWADRIGRPRTVLIGLICMIVSVLALVLKFPVPLLAVVMVVWGLGWTLNHAGLSTVLTDLPPEVLNEAASLNSSVRFLSGGAGMTLGGVLLKQDFNAGFLVFAAALVLLLVSSTYLIPRRRA